MSRYFTYLFTGFFAACLACAGAFLVVVFIMALIGNFLSLFIAEMAPMTIQMLSFSLVGCVFLGGSMLGLCGTFVICCVMECAMLRSNKLNEQQRQRLAAQHPCQFSSMHNYCLTVCDIYLEAQPGKERFAPFMRAVSSISKISVITLCVSFVVLALIVVVDKPFIYS